MLQHLAISNYAIIDELELSFDPHFSVITGETGAGKSILLGALSLVLGKRVDTSVLNNNEKKCIVEATFSAMHKGLEEILMVNDLDVEQETIIRREISAAGKSRAFVNDTPVSLSVLKTVSQFLFDIHTQHETLEVQNNQFQLNVVDTFVGLEERVAQFREAYKAYQKEAQRLAQLMDEEKNKRADHDYILFQMNEIEQLKLEKGEQQQLEDQLSLAENGAQIKGTLANGVLLLNQQENSIIPRLSELVNAFKGIHEFSAAYETIFNRLNSVYIELEDIDRDIQNLNENTALDVQNAAEIKDRLNSVYSLLQKHHLSNADELLDLLNGYKDQLSDNSSLSEEIERLKASVLTTENALLGLAKKISDSRKKGFKKLSATIVDNLKDLGMPDAQVSIHHEISSELSENGIDEVQFLFSANKGFDMQPLNKTASGGELSRLMLTIKSLLANSTQVNTLIFDEIDTGVSGDVADKMGAIMQVMSKSRQVIAITHLPQVAARGDSHFGIYKTNVKGKTHTRVKKLTEELRIEEVAKMLSGKEMSKQAIENAKNLMMAKG